jgi:putative transposase
MLRAYKYRLYPTPEQAAYLSRSQGCVRFVYNWGLEKKIKSYQSQKEQGIEKPKSLSIYDLCKELAQLKKNPEFRWLNGPPASSLMWALYNLDKAFRNFFRNFKNGGPSGFPKFKARSFRGSLQFHQGYSVDFASGIVKMPKCPNVKCLFHRTFEGELKTATVSQEPSGRFFISILVETRNELPDKKLFEKAVGIDLGVRNFITLSDGKRWDSNLILSGERKKLARAQKKLTRKEKGSKNKDKQRRRVARMHEKITDARSGYHQRVSSELINYAVEKEYDTLVLRDYDIRKIMKKPDVIEEVKNGKTYFEKNNRAVKRKINNMISDVAWGKFLLILKNKADKEGINIVEVNGAYTSQKCAQCGYVADENVKKDAFVCQACGHKEDSDLNAAINTKEEYITSLIA